MDKLEKYRKIIESVVKKHAQYKPSHGQIESLSICDKEADNYLLMDTGWDKTGRVHAVVFHLRIVEGKVWIEWDGTERGITEDLLDLGVAFIRYCEAGLFVPNSVNLGWISAKLSPGADGLKTL